MGVLPMRRLEGVAQPGSLGGGSGRALVTAAELEVAVVQRPAPEKLARPAPGAQAGRGDAVEQLADRTPLVDRHARVKRGEFLAQSRFPTDGLHT